MKFPVDTRVSGRYGAAGNETHRSPSREVGGAVRVVSRRSGGVMPETHDCKRVIGRGRCVRPRYWLSREWKKHIVAAKRGHFVLCSKRHWGVSVWSCVRDGAETLIFPDCSTYMEMTLMKRRGTPTERKDTLHLAAVESVILTKLHPLVAHCCHTQYEDGTARKPGWWTVKTMGSAWVVEVKDPDSCSRLVVVQQTLDDALTLASVLLESEEAPWEPDPWLKAAESKGKRK